MVSARLDGMWGDMETDVERVTRDDVVAAALRALRRGGPDALSMRRLAEDLGVSYQVVYSRVGGKADLVRAVHDAGFEVVRRRVAALPQRAGSADLVLAIARDYLAFARADPILFAVMFASPVPEFVRDDDARAVELDAFRWCWVAGVRAWLAEQDLPSGDGVAVRLAWRLWTAVHGITVVHLAGHSSPSGDPDVEVDLIVGDILANPIGVGGP